MGGAAIQKESDVHLYQQVMELIQRMRDTGSLRVGEKLPSLRRLSNQLQISVPTVKQAYLELERLGAIEAKPKSGYYLLCNDSLAQPKKPRMATRPVNVKRQSLIEQVYQAVHEPNVVPLGLANPAMVHPLEKALARNMRRVISQAGSAVMTYGPIDGFVRLKQQLALWYLGLGVTVDPDDIVITNGAQEALAIALHCVARPGDIIAVESPTYFGVLELIESLGMLVLEIPACPTEGILVDDVATALEHHDIKACVFSSSINNPLGSLMPQQARERLVALFEKKNIPLIEDDVYGDLYFGEHRATPAQAFSRRGNVITCSSFSKTAAPGYRVGWMIPGKYTEEAKRFKRSLSSATSLLNQWTLSEFLASGEYERNIRMLRNILRGNKERMSAALQRCLPQGTRLSAPQGGGVIWAEFAKGFDTTALFHRALDHNIAIAPGEIFSPSPKYKHCTRISYGLPWDTRLENAVRQLGKIAAAMA